MGNLLEIQHPVNTPGYPTKTLCYGVLRLDYALTPNQIPLLRRFINLFIGHDNDLFHNHQTPQQFHYRYPLIQYKIIEGKAALLGLGEEGVAALHQLAAHNDFRAHCAGWMGEGNIWQEEYSEDLQLMPGLDFQYRLRNYIALNGANIKAWHNHPSLPARAALVERCLTSHILKFASAIRWQLPPHGLQVALSDYRVGNGKSFDTRFLTFDVLFRTNITLPNHIGLGKSVSHGFGVVTAV